MPDISSFKIEELKDILKAIDRERRVIMSELPGIRSLPPKQLSAPSGAYDDPMEQVVKSLSEIRMLIQMGFRRLP